MTQTLLVATYLPTINQMKHGCPVCILFGQGGSQKESISHFLSTCAAELLSVRQDWSKIMSLL